MIWVINWCSQLLWKVELAVKTEHESGRETVCGLFGDLLCPVPNCLDMRR